MFRLNDFFSFFYAREKKEWAGKENGVLLFLEAGHRQNDDSPTYYGVASSFEEEKEVERKRNIANTERRETYDGTEIWSVPRP